VDDDSKLNQIRSSSLNQVRLIRSIELEMQFDTRIHFSDSAFRGVPPEDRKIPQDIVQKGTLKYVESGGKFRIEAEAGAADSGAKDTEVSAFNGNRYQLLYKERKGLTTKKSPLTLNPCRTSNPLTMVYTWLLNDDSIHLLSEVKNEKSWQEKFATARYVGQRKEGEFNAAVVEFPYTFGEVPESVGRAVVQVYFAEELGYYPVLVIAKSKDAGRFGEIRVDKYKEFMIDGQKVIVPLEFTQKMSVPTEDETSGKFSISLESIKINNPIDEDLFTISPTLATVVEDADVTQLEADKLSKERADRLRRADDWRHRTKTNTSSLASGGSRVTGLVFTGAVIAFLTLLIYRRQVMSQ